jgi:hypothetical protein
MNSLFCLRRGASAVILIILGAWNHAHAANPVVETVDSRSKSQPFGSMICDEPANVPYSSGVRLIGVSGAEHRITFRGQRLPANMSFSCQGCTVGEVDKSDRRITVDVRMGSTGSVPRLTGVAPATTTAARFTAEVAFDVVESALVRSIEPKRDILVGTEVLVSGGGLSSMDFVPTPCFSLVSKSGDSFRLRSACAAGTPVGTQTAQQFEFKLTAQPTRCVIKHNSVILGVASGQNLDLEITALNSPSVRVDPVTADRKVADSFCTGEERVIEKDEVCTFLPGVETRRAQGISESPTCVVKAVKTISFTKPLPRTKVNFIYKNISGASAETPFDVVMKDGQGQTIVTKRQTSGFGPNRTQFLEFVRPTDRIVYVKVTDKSSNRFLIDYGRPGCYRALPNFEGLSAAAANYSETGFTAVVDPNNETADTNRANNMVTTNPR